MHKLVIHSHLKPYKESAGFTLVEVLVALAIVGLALPALLFYMTSLADTNAYLRDKTVAQWIASNLYAEAQITRRLSSEVLEGSAGDEVEMANSNWRWQIEGYGLEEPFDGIQRLDISVYRNDQLTNGRVTNNRVNKGLVTEDPLVSLQGLIER